MTVQTRHQGRMTVSEMFRDYHRAALRLAGGVLLRQPERAADKRLGAYFEQIVDLPPEAVDYFTDGGRIGMRHISSLSLAEREMTVKRIVTYLRGRS